MKQVFKVLVIVSIFIKASRFLCLSACWKKLFKLLPSSTSLFLRLIDMQLLNSVEGKYILIENTKLSQKLLSNWEQWIDITDFPKKQFSEN